MDLETKQMCIAETLNDMIKDDLTIGDTKEQTIEGLERIKERIDEIIDKWNRGCNDE